MNEYEICFTEPVLPATALLLLVAAYWLLVILGALDMGLFDFDFDLDADGSPGGLEGVLGAGFAVVRFLNLGDIPLMLWVSTYALSFWMTSVIWFDVSYTESTAVIIQVILRNMVIALVATKVITQPMLRLVDRTKVTRHQDLIGKPCEITTDEVSEDYGQARVATGSSPLLINARTRNGVLQKGESVQIVDYDDERHVFFVEKAQTEVNA
jgi:hypothetical protein